jgi:signal transduction histidine kinase
MKLNHENDILSSQISVQENTFVEIAREIHDNISLTLTLAKLNLNTLNFQEHNEDKIKIENAVDLISKSIYDLNNLSKSIDGDIISRYGLINSLQKELESINKIGKIEVTLSIIGTDRYLDQSVELGIFRIIQESIKNSIIHSSATLVSIEMNYQENTIEILIEDNGKGFNVNVTEDRKMPKFSSGIKNMRNRAKLINGELDIISTIEKGTKIYLKIKNK